MITNESELVEALRRSRLVEINIARADRPHLGSAPWTSLGSAALRQDFEVLEFAAPYVVVRRRSDVRWAASNSKMSRGSISTLRPTGPNNDDPLEVGSKSDHENRTSLHPIPNKISAEKSEADLLDSGAVPAGQARFRSSKLSKFHGWELREINTNAPKSDGPCSIHLSKAGSGFSELGLPQSMTSLWQRR